MPHYKQLNRTSEFLGVLYLYRGSKVLLKYLPNIINMSDPMKSIFLSHKTNRTHPQGTSCLSGLGSVSRLLQAHRRESSALSGLNPVPGSATAMFHCGKSPSVQCLCFHSRPGLVDAALVFLWNPPTRCMEPARQTGKQLKFLQRGSDPLFIRRDLWHERSRKFSPRGSL